MRFCSIVSMTAGQLAYINSIIFDDDNWPDI